MPSAIKEPSLTFHRLHDTFAIEVSGIDWSSPIPESQFDEIREAIDREGVLVFRETKLDNDAQIAFTRQLGELDDVKAHIKAGRAMRFPDQPEIFDVSNLDHNDNIITDEDPARKEGNKGNTLWHADMVYNPRRAAWSFLRAVELPPQGSGGETQYLDSRTAYEDLPQDLKDEVGPLITNNSLFWNRKQGSPEYFKDLDPDQYPYARHRLVQQHEGSGRKNLVLTSYAHHFDGMTHEESKPLMDKLWAHVTQPKYMCTVEWLNPNDCVLWDNRAVLHRATSGGSYDGKYRRDMRRTTVKDTKLGEDGVEWQTGIPGNYKK